MNANQPTQAVILAGGMGTRLMPHTKSLPKPMIDCNGKPFLWFLLHQLAINGVVNFLILTGYHGEKISNYFQDGRKWGWKINYHHGPISWNTGKRLWEAKALLNERFFLLYSDNYCHLNFNELINKSSKSEAALVCSVSNKTPGNITFFDDLLHVDYSKTRREDYKYVDIGYMVANRNKLFTYFADPDCNFNEVIARVSSDRQLAGYVAPLPYRSISDPERWKIAKSYLESKKIILIDRDGVINKKAAKGDYIKNWKDFEVIEGTVRAMQDLSLAGYKFIVVSNQAGIGRGLMTKDSVEEIHRKMISLLKDQKIEVLEVFYCPHHWDYNCACRKPNTELFLRASEKYNFCLDQTVYIGDDIRDMEAANNLGITGILIDDDFQEVFERQLNFYQFGSLEKAVNFIKEKLSDNHSDAI